MSLTVDDIMHLERSTKYREEDIRKWFRSDVDPLSTLSLLHSHLTLKTNVIVAKQAKQKGIKLI